MAKGKDTDTLIDGHVSLKQCKLAVDALHAHTTKFEKQREETELLPGKEQNIWLNVTVKKIASAHRFKPVKIPITHPLVDPRVESVCLITKDPQRKYKDLLEENGIKFISRVVGIEKLKGKFKPFEARRALLKENGLFLADERVVPLLPKLLGVKWFEAKKQPIPVCLTRKDLKGELERAISSTYMNQNQGTCTAVKISKVSHTPAQVLQNLQTALPVIIRSIKGEWDNVQSLLLKTNSSAGLPIWSCDLGDADGGRWSGLVAESDEDEGSDEDMEEEKSVRKGKKRAVAEDEDEEPEEPKTKKKAKGAEGKALPTSQTPPAKPKLAAAAPPAKTKPDESTAPPKSKKPKTSLGGEAPPGASPQAKKKEKTVQPAEEKPKEKKAGKLESEPASAPVSGKKKQAKGADADAAPSSEALKGKKAEAKAKTPAASSAPTKDELKQKRAGQAGERKKEVIIKSKGGKSAKDRIIGKKVGK